MKKAFITLCALITVSSAFALQTIEQKAPITQAVVYNDRVEITRSYRNNYQPGEYQVKLLDLPSSLDDNSVRASGAGTAEVKINAVKIESVYLDTTTNLKYKVLEDSVEQLREQLKVNDDRYSLLQKEADYLEKIKTVSITVSEGGREKEQPKALTVAEWTGLYTFYDARHESINKEMRGIEKGKKSLQLKLEAIQRRLNKIAGTANLTKKNVTINFRVQKEGSLGLNLSYMMMGASWHPQYDIRVSPDNKKVEFTYFGVIYQNTGEDWKDVKVTLSTAQPSVSGSMPALSPWYLDVYQRYYQKGDAAKKSQMNVSYGAQMNQAPAPAMEQMQVMADGGSTIRTVSTMEVSTSDVEFSGTSYVFVTPGENNIPSDGEPHKIPIAFETLDADFEYSAAPRIKQYAYLKGKVKNTTEYPFIAGDINVFFGNNFVGVSSINSITPTEKFDVSLGIDEGIKITRIKVKDLTEGNKKIKKTYGYKIAVKNLKATREILTVNEQYPVSKNDKIKVKLVSPKFDDPEAAFGVKEKANGIIEWKMELGPQEKKELELEYIIEYPSDTGIQGL